MGDKAILSVPNVNAAVIDTATWIAAVMRDRFTDDVSMMASMGSFDSPIEAIFYAYFTAYAEANGRIFTLHPQHEVQCGEAKYRLDFILEVNDTDLLYEAYLHGCEFQPMAIELDGHDFHERTKEQVTYRNQRDRDLQAAGWRVMHYSGSELHASPARAVLDAHAMALNHWHECQRRLRAAKRSYLAGLERLR